MTVAALLAALVALILAGTALRQAAHLRRVLEQHGRGIRGTDEELLKDAWLDEIESRGEAVLARIAAAEESLHRWQEQVAAAGEARSSVDTDTERPAAGAMGGELRGTPRAPDRPAYAGAALRSPGVADQVRQLSAQGIDPTTIARRLGIGRGEVELILGLPQADRG
ncbi:MAG: hypothetical protein BAA04_05600 [Firmicutes bacterium ZCTH02-B6]|nr:MAG: hypothetical protein BAA04_05600 [Firmicutes bacterium ZCTH02-B6]